jgi:photosystem II stability/assembly factor-like uncharacterized protein
MSAINDRRFVSRISWLFILTAIVMSGLTPLFADGGYVVKDPSNFGDWEIVGPSGGDVRVVTIDPRDKNRLYISTLDGQVHTSADGGKTWRLLANFNKPGLILDQLFVDSRNSNIIYASGHRHKFPGGFFKTIDGGATWKESKELKSESIHSMTQSQFDPDTLLVGTPTGIWMSKDSGDEWQKLSSSTMPHDIDSIAIDPRNGSTIYAGTWWRPYKTTDSGKNWRLIKDGMIDDSDVFTVTIDPRNNDHIISSACSGIYESVNGGEKWAKIQGIPSQSRRTRDLLQHPSVAGTVYAATTEGFWMTTNGGKAWQLTTQRNLEINSIAVHPDEPNRVFIGTNNYGVMVSNDGGRNFVPTNINFSSRFASSITPDLERPNRLYLTTNNTTTGGGFFYISDDGGRSWNPTRSLDIARIAPFAVLQDKTNPGLMYLGTNVGLYKSLDRGNTWTQIVAPKPVKNTPVKKAPARGKVAAKTTAAKTAPAAAAPKLVPALTDKIKVLAFTEDGKNGILAGTDSGLYRSYDLTKGWEKLSFGAGLNESVMVITTTPGALWVGTATSGALVSRDEGKTWTKTGSANGGAVDGIPIASITIDPKKPNNIYVGSIQALYLTRDGGATWSRRGGNLPLGNFTTILINPNNSNEIYASSALEADGGIYYSSDAGMKWKRVDSKEMKLPTRRIWTMAFDPTNPNRIYAGTHSSGVYRIERRSDTAAIDTDARPRVSTNE